jgi:hypothetical protein
MRENASFLENPFKVQGITEISYVTKANEDLVVDQNTGELYTMKKVPKSYPNQKHDPLTYTKWFQGGCTSLMDLPTPSIKMLLYAIDRLRPLQDAIYMNLDDCMEVCRFKSATSYREGVKGLIEAKIMARKVGSNMEFWINPNMFFNGNRLRML